MLVPIALMSYADLLGLLALANGGSYRIRRYAETIPQVRKNRLKGRKPLQEAGRQALYHLVKIGAWVAERPD